MQDDWFEALEKRAALDNDKPWPFDADWIIVGLFIVFLALCAADLI